ncbi:amidohydrolase family protein [Streptomyces albipurpureus]|uniref:Amidohydrolase n=1 Tax=Streptomyces albipurpureus TaxID=2897419 RepID=A0ABT0ULZ9_9ACTN|nr:amidohydrolase family protein [Streptomyces sp. CWNU-1]MCM2389644.1 amidohydrolase [Streptomyces sp. CWNU-1]
MTEPDFLGFDGDNHYYEATDAFTRHLEPEFAGAVQWAEINKRQRLVLSGKVCNFLPNPTFSKLAAPGSLEQYFRGNNESGGSIISQFGALEPIRPEYRDRDARITVMDEQRLEGAFFFPTLGVGIEQGMRHDLPASRAAFRAFNRWLNEDWGFAYKNRIFAAPYITLSDPDAAVEELKWVLEQGARIVVQQTGPIKTAEGYKSPADPRFDRYWATVAEAGITVSYHSGDTAYSQILGMWGEDEEMNAHHMTLMRAVVSPAPERDTIGALITGGVFARHPNLRVAIIESGADWAAPLLKSLGKSFGQQHQLYAEDPEDTFARHVWVTPFYENDLREVGALLGADRMVMGSDWPHTEGLANPLDFKKDLDAADFSAADQRLIMRENGLALSRPRISALT